MDIHEQRAAEDALARDHWEGVAEYEALYNSLDEAERQEPLGQRLAERIYEHREAIRIRTIENGRKGLYVPRSTVELPPMPNLSYENLERIIAEQSAE